MSRSQLISIFFSVQMIAIALLFGCSSTPGRDKPLDPVMATAVSPDNNLIAVSTDSQEVAFFDVSPLRFRSLLTPEGVKMKPNVGGLFRSPPLAFSEDGQLLFAAGVGGQVTGWDVRSGAQIFSSPIETGVVDLVVLPDNSAFITAGPGVTVWTTDTGNLSAKLELPPEVNATSVNVSVDGQAILVGLSSGDIAVYGSADRKLIRTFKGHQVPVTGLALAPDGKTFASSAGLYDPRLWSIDDNIESPEVAQNVDPGSTATQTNNETQSGKVLSWLLSDVIAIGFQLLGALPLGAFHLTSEDPAKQNSPYCGPRVAFSPDGRYLASTATLGGGCCQLFLTDLANNKKREIGKVYGCSVAFTRDSKIVITGGLGAPALWYTTTGERVTANTGKE